MYWRPTLGNSPEQNPGLRNRHNPEYIFEQAAVGEIRMLSRSSPKAVSCRSRRLRVYPASFHTSHSQNLARATALDKPGMRATSRRLHRWRLCHPRALCNPARQVPLTVVDFPAPGGPTNVTASSLIATGTSVQANDAFVAKQDSQNWAEQKRSGLFQARILRPHSPHVFVVAIKPELMAIGISQVTQLLVPDAPNSQGGVSQGVLDKACVDEFPGLICKCCGRR